MKTPVLIVGAGPTGLILALWLTRLGVAVRIIDKNADAGKESRAIGIQAHTLEQYQQIGLAEEIIKNGIKADMLTIRKNGDKTFSLPLIDMGKGLSPFPFFLFLPQDEHEKILIEHLRHAGVNIERNTELQTFTQKKKHVEVTLKSERGLETIDFAYLCGCDGARSTIRNRLNIKFPGGTYSQIFYVADVMARRGDYTNHNLQICVSQKDFCLVLPVRSTGSLRLIGIVPEERENKDAITFEDVLPSLSNNTDIKVESLNWFSTYHVHHRVANHFRLNHVFLMGDAAHIHSPAGAQGMNTGIGDAINLAWKIAAVLKDNASTSLLDTYEIERKTFANQLVETTDKLFQIMTDKGLLGKCWRGFIFPYLLPLLFRLPSIRRFFFKLTSQIKINYRQSALSKGHANTLYGGDRLPWVKYETTDNFSSLKSMNWQIHIYGEASETFAIDIKNLNLELHIFPWNKQAENAGLEKDAIYLIRPDGYISYIDNHQDIQKLETFYNALNLKME